MSAQHTPGPWFVPQQNAGSCGTSVWARGGDVRIADCNSGAISLPGRQCDARLIAAAPELLEALMRCRFDSLNMSPADLEFCRAVVARATGAAS